MCRFAARNASSWRRRKVHLPPFPSAAKTAPAPLLLRSSQRPLRWISAGPQKRLAEKKTHRARCKRKGASPQCTRRVHCGDAGLRKPLYELARCNRLVRVWPDLALPLRPRPRSANLGCKTDLAYLSFRCRCPDDCRRTGSQTTPDAFNLRPGIAELGRSFFHPYRPGSAEQSGERGKRSRGLSMSTPPQHTPHPRELHPQKSYHVRREPVGGHPGTGSTDSEDPRCAKLTPKRGQLCKEQRFSFGPCTARFLWRNQRKWGVHSRGAKPHTPVPPPWGGLSRPRAVRGHLPPAGRTSPSPRNARLPRPAGQTPPFPSRGTKGGPLCPIPPRSSP